MRLGIKILENDSQIQKSILLALLPECTSFMNGVIKNLKTKIPDTVIKYIIDRPEYQSLVNGSLRLELGIPDANNKVLELIGFWIQNIRFHFTSPMIAGSKIKSSFSIEMIKADFSDILGSDAAYVYDRVRGYSLQWLEWLLLDGSKTLVPSYNVSVGPNPRSRTGFAIMRLSSAGWNVPSEFAGTQSDNWITRAIDDADNDIKSILESSLS